MASYKQIRLSMLAAGSLVAMSFSGAVAAYADQVLRIVHFTSGSLQQQQQAMQLVDSEINKLYAAAKGFKSVKYFYNSKSLETGSVSVWDSQASLDAFLKSEGYKPIAGKLKPMMVGEMSSAVYTVHEPK